MSSTDTIFTLKELQAYLKIGKNTALRLIHDGYIDAHRIGNRWKIRKSDVDEYLHHN